MIIQEHHLRISKGVDGRMVDVDLRLTPLQLVSKGLLEKIVPTGVYAL